MTGAGGRMTVGTTVGDAAARRDEEASGFAVMNGERKGTLRRAVGRLRRAKGRQRATRARTTDKKAGGAAACRPPFRQPPSLPPPLSWVGRVQDPPPPPDVEYPAGYWDYVGEL